MKGFRSAGLVLAGALTLAGCGGGGGSDPVELVTLDGNNAVNAASATYDAVSTTDMASILAQEMMGMAATQQPSIEQFVLRDFAKEQLDKFIQLDSGTVHIAAMPEESSCYPSGKIIVTENDVEPRAKVESGVWPPGRMS